MDTAEFAEFCTWIAEAGLEGQSEDAILAGFCERQIVRGMPLARGIVLIDTLHPIYEGRAFRWTRAQKQTTLSEYGRSDDDLSRWRRSPFSQLEETCESLLRRRLTADTESEFSIFPELRADRMTDYVAIANRLSGNEVIGDMDCVYSSWASDAPQGFRDDDIANLCRLMPFCGEIGIVGAHRRNVGGNVSRT
jgi:adenylate cyclase